MVVVEVTRKAYLASLVPVIVDAILNEHQVVADIVAFVSNGDFPRSRLGEKQRGKVLGSWVTRKLRTIAQFSIRDMDDNPFTEVPQHRVSRSSKPGSTMGNSLRRSTEPDVPTVPPSPAAAVPQQGNVAPEAHQDHFPPPNTLPEPDTRTDSHVSSTPAIRATSTVPSIQEPQSGMVHSADDGHDQSGAPEPAPEPAPTPSSAEPGPARDFRFSFDMIGAQTASKTQGSAAPVTEKISTGRESLPSQQTGYGEAHAITSPVYEEKPRPGTQESGLIDDWPQEALMYQSTMHSEDGQDVRRTPHADAQQRYDNSGYGI